MKRYINTKPGVRSEHPKFPDTFSLPSHRPRPLDIPDGWKHTSIAFIGVVGRRQAPKRYRVQRVPRIDPDVQRRNPKFDTKFRVNIPRCVNRRQINKVKNCAWKKRGDNGLRRKDVAVTFWPEPVATIEPETIVISSDSDGESAATISSDDAEPADAATVAGESTPTVDGSVTAALDSTADSDSDEAFYSRIHAESIRLTRKHIRAFLDTTPQPSPGPCRQCYPTAKISQPGPLDSSVDFADDDSTWELPPFPARLTEDS